MNLANKLTLLRVILIPFFVFFMAMPSIPFSEIISIIIFAAAAITDYFDGNLARQNNMITNFGIFMDPFADKLLVTSALVMLQYVDLVPPWVVLIIIAREFAVSGLRTVAANEGHVIAASNLGKIKTALQMAGIVAMLIKFAILNSEILSMLKNNTFINDYFLLIPDILIYAAAIMTLYSGFDYFKKSWKAIDPTK